MEITNQYASALDLFGVNSVNGSQDEEEKSSTVSLGSDGDSVTISDEARQLYAQKSAASETAEPAAAQQGGAGGGFSGSGSSSEDDDTSEIQTQIQSLQGQLAALQASSDGDNAGEIAALQSQIASLKAQLD